MTLFIKEAFGNQNIQPTAFELKNLY